MIIKHAHGKGKAKRCAGDLPYLPHIERATNREISSSNVSSKPSSPRFIYSSSNNETGHTMIT